MTVRCRDCGRHVSLVEAANGFLARQCLLWAHQLTCVAQPLIPMLSDWLDPVQRAKYSWKIATHVGRYFSCELHAYTRVEEESPIGRVEIYRDLGSGVTGLWHVIPVTSTAAQRQRVLACGLPYTGTGDFRAITQIVRSAVNVFWVDQQLVQS